MGRGQTVELPKGKFDLKVTPKQHKMLVELSHVDEMLWGGQAGGGKSEGLLLFALLRRLFCPGSVGLMLRRKFPELDKSLIRKSKRYFHNFAKWNEAKRQWIFPNGSIQEAGYLETDNDLDQYQSAEYDDIIFDELTHFTEYQYTYMRSRLRSQIGGNWKTVIRSASNPGKVGHAWVKAYFVDPAREKVHKVWDNEIGEYKTRYFLPATLDDNTLMTKKQRAEYRSWLAGLSDQDRRQLMHGDWDFVPGAAFEEFNREIHVCEPMPVPSWAEIMCTFDWGFGKPFSVGWEWIDYDGRMWRFAEWYGWSGKPDQGIRMAPSQVARGILERERAMKLDPQRPIYRVADPSIFAKQPNIKGGGQGPSVAEMMGDEGVHWSPGDNDRLQGKAQFHERLRRPSEDELPMMMVYSTCEQFLRCFPTLVVDEKNVEDIDTTQEDHNYDEFRYGLMARPLVPIAMKAPQTYAQEIIGRVMAPPDPTREIEELERMYMGGE
jgi:hypothetical protein